MYLKDDITAKEVAQNYKNADMDGKIHIRKQVRQMDFERFGNVLKNAHIHLSMADNTTIGEIKTLYTQEMLEWVGVYGLVEDLRTFEDITGITR